MEKRDCPTDGGQPFARIRHVPQACFAPNTCKPFFREENTCRVTLSSLKSQDVRGISCLGRETPQGAQPDGGPGAVPLSETRGRRSRRRPKRPRSPQKRKRGARRQAGHPGSAGRTVLLGPAGGRSSVSPIPRRCHHRKSSRGREHRWVAGEPARQRRLLPLPTDPAGQQQPRSLPAPLRSGRRRTLPGGSPSPPVPCGRATAAPQGPRREAPGGGRCPTAAAGPAAPPPSPRPARPPRPGNVRRRPSPPSP